MRGSSSWAIHGGASEPHTSTRSRVRSRIHLVPHGTRSTRGTSREPGATMIDWPTALGFEQAARNVRSDIFGDWYRDPWGWPENEWIASKAPGFLVDRLKAHDANRAIPIEVPKENFVLRPATLLDPVDRLAYQALVDSLSTALIGDMPDFVFGWRLPADPPIKGVYAKNGNQWQAFRERLQDLGDKHDHGLTTDIVSFFQSVSINRLEEDLRQRLKGNAVVDRILAYLRAWDDLPSRGGLPQRCLASSVLAQFFLRAMDDLLSLHVRGGAGRQGLKPVEVCRWMDDIWVFSDHWSGLRAVQLDLQGCLWDLNLTLNAGKTKARDGEDLRRVIREYEHSAADFGLRFKDYAPLEELVDRILASPDTASRTTISFVTNRLRRHELSLKIEGFVEKAPQMPHAADHLARLFRDLQAWRDLEEWYVDYLSDSGRSIEWAGYQLGTMFPNSERNSDVVLRRFTEGLAAVQLPLVMVPLAAQRIAAWAPGEARGLIEHLARAGVYPQPFALRALAYAGVGVGVARSTVKSLLKQHAESEPMLALLESRDFKPLPVVDDFGGERTNA
jgi:hypothetical protein